MYLKDNLEDIKNNIQKTLERCGRSSEKINLIGVTKTIDVETVKDSIDYGIKNIGENRVQELEKKIDEIGTKVNYHMIGHLQTNKVRKIIDKVSLVHSLERMSLAKELNKRAKMNDLVIDTLLQVNISEEESKFGLRVSEVVPFIERILEFEHINIRGLMTIAPHTDDESIVRGVFRELYNLKEEIEKRNYKDINMDYLSMGMTNDYKIAIEEGSNMLRIGTGIYGKRNY
ncbi:MAG TPA: YggS family pyridoxal phosphate-dependent enzyme [Tissierellaceae bacterium]|nr:YggS family pyridoxal phosphate-dependent enzyme [Tissierellaceae bacterium]